MKKKLLTLTICISIVLFVCACGTDNTSTELDNSSTQIKNNSELASDNSFEVNKTIYEDNLITLNCKNITTESILFEVTNKIDYEIEWLNLQVSLDGVQLPLYAYDSSDKNIEAKETREINMSGDIGEIEHQRISLSGDIFVDGSSKGQIDVCDFGLEGNENIPMIETKNQLYDDEIVTIYYNECVIDTIKFCVENKTDRAITVGFWASDKLIINGKEYNASVVTINAHSKGAYDSYLSSSDGSTVQITELDSLQGIFGVKDQNNKDIEDINLNFSEK